MKSICFVAPFLTKEMILNIIERTKALATSKYTISIICYVGNDIDYLERHCKSVGIKYIRIEKLDSTLSIKNIPFLVSYKIMQTVCDEAYDIIRFIDYFGGGFHTIQCKRTLGKLQDTTLIIDLYGPSQYINELNEDWGYGGFEQLMVQYMERYCCEFCDLLTVFSEYLIQWANERRWNLCENQIVMQNINFKDSSKQISSNPSISHIIFYGELSRKGGLHLICNCLKRFNSEEAIKINKITFIGENKTFDNTDGVTYVKRQLENLNFSYEILDICDFDDLLVSVNNTNFVIVFASLAASLSIEFTKAIQSKISILVIDSAENKEFICEDFLFSNNPDSLKNKLLNIDLIDFQKTNKKCDYEKINEMWNNSNSFKFPPQYNIEHINYKISICIAYYNHGKYLPMALSSLENVKYDNFEVVVVNDGSTEQFSIEQFYILKEKYNNWKFLTKNNEGPSIARNYGAEYAEGDYIIFMDSDNLAKPEMLSIFMNGINYSGCDCLSCYFDRFYGSGCDPEKNIEETYVLIGPSLEIGIFANCFGDTNFIVRKEVFNAVGGFYKGRVVTEDWQFLSRLTLKGYKMDVLPVSLFWYRVLPESNVAFGSEYKKQLMIIQTYCNELPPYIYHIMNSLYRPSFENNNLNISPSDILYFKFKLFIKNKFPIQSKIGKFLRTIIFKYSLKE